MDLTQIHYLSGPFDVETAEPGDVLLVEIQDVQPFEEQPWGFSGVFHKENGGGFLDQLYPEAYVTVDLMVFRNISTLTCLAEPKLSGILKESSAHLAISHMFGVRD